MAAMLLGAVSAPAEFATLFSDALKDPTNNNPQSLLNPFLRNLNDNTNNISTENIREILVAAGHRRFAIGEIIISQGRVCPYLLCYRWENALTGPGPDLDEKIFAFDGELVKNHGHTVEINAGVFSLLANQVLVVTVGQILTALAGTSKMEWMGPYTAGDGNTKVVKTRRIVIIPHSVLGLFLASPNGITADTTSRLFKPNCKMRERMGIVWH